MLPRPAAAERLSPSSEFFRRNLRPANVRIATRFSDTMPRLIQYLTLASILVPHSATAADWTTRWNQSYAADGRRFIPVELWTGSEWNGKPAINLQITDI